MITRLFVFLAVVCLLAENCRPAHSAAPGGVRILLKSGRWVAGDEVRPGTDSTTLVLGTRRERMKVTHRIPWNKINAAKIGGLTFARDDFIASIRDSKFAMLPTTGTSETSGLHGKLTERARVSTNSAVYGNHVHREFSEETKSRNANLRNLPAPPDTTNVGVDKGIDPEPNRYSEEFPLSAAAYDQPHDFSFPCLAASGVILGVREDPLSAYAAEIAHFFPDGVPLSEAGFALELMRARKVQEVLGGSEPLAPAIPHPSPLQPSLPEPQGAVPPVRANPVAPRGRLREIDVAARPVSTDGTADWDALEIEITGTDSSGAPVPIRGSLYVTLFGRAQHLVRAHSDQFAARLGRVRKLADWTRTVGHRTSHVSLSAATSGKALAQRFTLSLPRPLPDHDSHVAALGELHVRLLSPGVGVFEAAQPALLLKHLSPLRDRELVETGSRFFSVESTTGSRIRAGKFLGRPSNLAPNGRILSVQP